MVQTANIAFRYISEQYLTVLYNNCRSENEKLLSLLDDYDIPVTVFSAGLAGIRTYISLLIPHFLCPL